MIPECALFDTVDIRVKPELSAGVTTDFTYVNLEGKLRILYTVSWRASAARKYLEEDLAKAGHLASPYDFGDLVGVTPKSGQSTTPDIKPTGIVVGKAWDAASGLWSCAIETDRGEVWSADAYQLMLLREAAE